jgi:hypothetical protein
MELLFGVAMELLGIAQATQRSSSRYRAAGPARLASPRSDTSDAIGREETILERGVSDTTVRTTNSVTQSAAE